MRSLLLRFLPVFVVRVIVQVKRFFQILQEYLARLISPPYRPTAPLGKTYLNLGCGTTIHPAFTNVDLLIARHIHYIRPVDNLRPFSDSSVDLVYVSHCLEHFSHHKIRQVLSEWRRVLKPGGILRLGVPDFDVLLAIYHANENNVNAIEQYLMGGQTYPLNAHYSIFTKKSLTELLFQVGFREVREWRHGSDDLTSLNDCTSLTTNVNGETLSISLNLEAIK